MYVACKVPSFLSDFNETEFSDRFWKNTKISNFMKSVKLGQSCSVQMDRQTGGQT